MKAVRCPVCGGLGEIVDKDSIYSTAIAKKTCHGCGGRGWIVVPD